MSDKESLININSDAMLRGSRTLTFGDLEVLRSRKHDLNDLSNCAALLSDKLCMIDLSWSHDFTLRKLIPAVLDMCELLRQRIATLVEVLADWQSEELSTINWEKRKYQEYYLKAVERNLERLSELKAKQDSEDYDQLLAKLQRKINQLKLK